MQIQHLPGTPINNLLYSVEAWNNYGIFHLDGNYHSGDFFIAFSTLVSFKGVQRQC